jgi:hypothetical protein
MSALDDCSLHLDTVCTTVEGTDWLALGFIGLCAALVLLWARR